MMDLTYPAMAEIMRHQLLKIQKRKKKSPEPVMLLNSQAGEIWKEDHGFDCI